MMRLLRAGFVRLYKNGIFRIAFAVSVIAGIFCSTVGPLLMNMVNVNTDGTIGRYGSLEVWCLDYHFFTYIIIIAFAVSVFCGFYVGTEYSDGTLRNKIVAGHSRVDIYFANLLTNAAAGCVLYAGYMIAALCAGLLYGGGFQYFKPGEVAVYVLCVYVLMMSLAAIFTMISMLVSNQTAAVLICIGGMLCLFLLSNYLGANLPVPEVYDEEVWSNGIYYPAGAQNPFYVGGTKRAVLLFLEDFLPGGQVEQFWALEWFRGNMNPRVMFGGSAAFAAASTVIGVLLFRKKELK